MLPGPQGYSDLAIIKKAPYQVIKLKGTVVLSPEQKLFEQAMEFYQKEDYVSAEDRLSAYVEIEPENIYGQFYLGVCLLLQDNIDESIKHLELASQLSHQQENQSFLEIIYWYLSNAYLKIEEAEKAQATFKKIIELQGEHEQDAKEQLNKIRSLKNN
jgi:tetratricopeptide (TPR) repeat protein